MNCTNCGRPIKFIANRSFKKKVPADPTAEYFTPTENGGVTFVTTQGSVRTGKPASDGLKGYRLHACG